MRSINIVNIIVNNIVNIIVNIASYLFCSFVFSKVLLSLES